MKLLLVMCVVGFGGGIGALLRHLSGKVLHGLLGFSEYVSVMMVNVTGCLLIGICFFLIEAFFNTELESRLRSLPMNSRSVADGIWPKKNPTQPVVRDFHRDLISELLAGFVITGVLGPESNAHGPNEFLHIPFGKKLSACIGYIINEFPS